MRLSEFFESFVGIVDQLLAFVFLIQSFGNCFYLFFPRDLPVFVFFRVHCGWRNRFKLLFRLVVDRMIHRDDFCRVGSRDSFDLLLIEARRGIFNNRWLLIPQQIFSPWPNRVRSSRPWRDSNRSFA